MPRKLTERERHILKLRYGLLDGSHWTHDKIAAVFNCSYEESVRTESRALQKLSKKHKIEIAKIRLTTIPKQRKLDLIGGLLVSNELWDWIK